MIPRVNGEMKAVDGVILKYSIFGDQGSWVVMVHSHMSSAYLNWIRPGIPQKLAERHRVVVFDCRNHGISSHPEPGGKGIPRDVVDLMDHLSIAQAHLHGYCMGGGIVITLLGAIPERIVTASVGGTGVSRTSSHPGMHSCSISEALVHPSGCVQAVDLFAVDVPVLAIVGSDDSPETRVGRMERELARFRSVIVPDCDHLDTYRHPQYVAAISDFIEAFDDPASANPARSMPIRLSPAFYVPVRQPTFQSHRPTTRDEES